MMKKIIVLSMATMLLSGTAFAQQTDVAAKTEHTKAAKHARKKKHRENGTVDAPREAKAVNSVKNAPRLQTQPGSAAF